MARGVVFGSHYTTGTLLSGNTPANNESIAELVLKRYQIPYEGSFGSSLPGYDIKSQDAVTMLRLSLLADGAVGAFPEIYTGPDGVARVILGGDTQAQEGSLGPCVLSTTTSNFNERVDHVLVRAKDPLPIRYNGPSLNVMGAGKTVAFTFNCAIGEPVKNSAMTQEAWAEFEHSPQSESVQKKLNNLVNRPAWEQLVGYKVTFADIPKYASFSLSQTTPRSAPVPFASTFDSSISIDLGNSDEDEGGVVDISNLNGVGSEVLSVVSASEILNRFPGQVKASDFPAGSGPNDYYALLNHQCGLVSISRGTNWFLLPGGSESRAILMLRPSGSAKSAYDIYHGFSNSVRFFRRRNESINNILDMVTQNLEESGEPFPSLSSVADYNTFRGAIVAGLGGSFGLELAGLELAYTIAKPSICVRSPLGDAPNIAANFAAGGIVYNSIILKDLPAATGWNGDVVYPPSPPQEEGEKYVVESPLDELEGSIVSIAAPYLGEGEAARLSAIIHSAINGDSGTYKSISYQSGGYGILPGMRMTAGVVHTIEFNYSDKDVVATNITTGPKYYPSGSFSDSQYVKRSETITRNARVVAGSNASGTFVVEVDGLGRYEAISEIIDTVYPGDKVQVKIINFPVEK